MASNSHAAQECDASETAATRIAHTLRAGARCLLDFVYPPHCAVCREPVVSLEQALCPFCRDEIVQPLANRCPRCSGVRVRTGALPGDPGSSLKDCSQCRNWPPVIERALVLGPFAGALREAVHAIKFAGHRRLAVELGMHLASLPGFEELGCIDLLIPVPLHPTRLRERGFNQSLLIARGIAAASGKPVAADKVRRVVATRQQAKLTAAERMQNLSSAFAASALPRGVVAGLVDDVITTGSTIGACAETLAARGASVVVLALASAPLKGA